MENEPGRERLLKFLQSWRDRLLKNGGAQKLNDEEFGQLAMLNTVIYFIETEL